jgi:hypothetical protein
LVRDPICSRGRLFGIRWSRSEGLLLSSATGVLNDAVAPVEPARARVLLGEDILLASRVIELRRRVNAAAHPCGCKSGAAMSTLALVGWPAWRITSEVPKTVVNIVLAVLAYAGVVVGAGVVGKLAGIAVGRARFRHLRQALDRALAEPAEGV